MAKAEIQETMNAVMQAHEIVGRFHRNVADLFRSISIDMEGRDVSYSPMDEDGGILLSPTTESLRKAGSWLCKHVAMALRPNDDDDYADGAPLLLAHVAVDRSFSDQPELWLGAFSGLQSHEGDSFPFEDSLSYIFEDYFGPEDQWSEEGKWYDVSFEDDVVAATMAFCRLPLMRLTDRDAVVGEVCDRLYEQVEASMDDEDE